MWTPSYISEAYKAIAEWVLLHALFLFVTCIIAFFYITFVWLGMELLPEVMQRHSASHLVGALFESDITIGHCLTGTLAVLAIATAGTVHTILLRH